MGSTVLPSRRLTRASFRTACSRNIFRSANWKGNSQSQTLLGGRGLETNRELSRAFPTMPKGSLEIFLMFGVDSLLQIQVQEPSDTEHSKHDVGKLRG